MDIDIDIMQIWTNPRVNERLDDLYTWSYGQVIKALEWLDLCDEMDEKADKVQNRK